MKFKIKQLLSRTPSKAIRQAVRDAKACEAHPDYILNMDNWHSILRSNDYCHVCLSGAVMARRTSASPREVVTPSDYPSNMQNKFKGLNHFREGHIGCGLLAFGIERSIAHQWRGRIHPDPLTGENHVPLFTSLLKLADDLELKGL